MNSILRLLVVLMLSLGLAGFGGTAFARSHHHPKHAAVVHKEKHARVHHEPSAKPHKASHHKARHHKGR